MWSWKKANSEKKRKSHHDIGDLSGVRFPVNLLMVFDEQCAPVRRWCEEL